MEGYLRIGELSRRAGVSPELLRAWERRYELLRPERSAGGFRLYGDEDVARVQVMRQHLSRGLSAAEAARLAVDTATAPPVSTAPPPGLVAELMEAFVAYDEVAAHASLDRLISTYSLETVLREALIPLLHEIGVRFERGELSIAQEHFASNLLRGRLMGLARGWGQGSGPSAVLACPPGEFHEFGLIAFGLALRARGWRITYLGADTPIATVLQAVKDMGPRIVALVAEHPERLGDHVKELATLGRQTALLLAGRGATPELALRVGGQLVRDDPVSAAAQVGA